MDVITYEYTKQRKDFGKHPSFGDSKPECISVKASHGEAEKQWVERMHTTTEVDCIPETAEHWVNTERFVQCHRGMQHTGGGWPKDVKSNDNQDRERFLRRLEALPPYSAAVRKLTRVAEKAIEQNNSIDIYEEYFASSEVDLTGEPPSAKTLCVFRDRSSSRRAATKLCWHPDGAPKLAVAYSCLGFQQMPSDMPLASYIWDVNSPNEPDVTILPPSPLSCLVYNPRTTDHLVGGCYNGLIGFWDLRKGSQPVECSVIEKSHHDPVYDIFWIQSRTGNECCSVSTDGQILWWDTRKLDAGPTDSMSLRGYTVPGHSESLSEAQQLIFGATCLDYRSDAGATRYLLGTEEGQAVLVDRKAKKEMAGVPDTGASKSIKTIFGSDAGRHHGPIYSIQRHPFAPKYFMTVGDWTTKVWMEDLKTPIMSSRYDSAYLTNGCWSPTRPSVLITTKVDGTLDVWDLLFKQTDPVFSTKVGDQPLCSIRVHPQGRMVAVGAADGTATIVEINSFLAEQQPNEKANIIQMLERETKREKNLEIRSNQKKKEATAGAKKGPSGDAPAASERPTSPQSAPVPSAAAVAAALKADEKMESLLKQVEADFFKAIEVKESVPALSVQTGAGADDGETVRTEEVEAPGSVKRAESAGKGKDASGESGKAESELMERAPNSAKAKLQDDEEARKALDDGQEPAAA